MIFIGTSGYFYREWKKRFYPEEIPQKDWLQYYASQFNAVEINSSFYRIPSSQKLNKWYQETPSGFQFAVKGYRYMTQLKKLKVDADVRQSLTAFFKSLEPLKDKAGPILWQCPKSLGYDLSKLQQFCRVLSGDFWHVMEFRNAPWFNEEVSQQLEDFGMGMCSVCAPGDLPNTLFYPGKKIYIRFHGYQYWYKDRYPGEVLRLWAENVKQAAPAQLWAFFNNTDRGNAIENAFSFKSFIADRIFI